MSQGVFLPAFFMENLKRLFFSRHERKLIPTLRQAVVGIAGAGGLGSNIAVSLARVGIGKLVIADFDLIDSSNLNRQQYFLQQIGEPKVKALKNNLEKINPWSDYEIHEIKITRANVGKVFGECHILLEAFDQAEMKEMLLDRWTSLFPERPIIMASGLAGFGKNELLKTRKLGNIYVCGDEISEPRKGISPMAPRVAIVANMQANLALELILGDFKDA